MFRTIVFSAFGAGLIVCAVVSAIQLFTTEPLILHAEQFEAGAVVHDHDGDSPTGHHHGEASAEDAGAWAPSDGLERIVFTVLANLLVGFAVSLALLGLMMLTGQSIDARQGVLWGAAGFAAAALLPALGLPPELPGTPAAELAGRQIWWLATVGASAGGIALVAFGRLWAVEAAGVALLVLPHAIGAPTPPSHDVTYPGALAGEFVVASLVVSAALWIVAGWSAGWLHRRLARIAG